ncbi:transcription initiation factor TFIID subunit A-domain-containing protein [Chlamydoabsidia padenii]|nr:transcription initiation factor TFIID subunit A-domain-containing protein [Chlamydoabsidia padenii]
MSGPPNPTTLAAAAAAAATRFNHSTGYNLTTPPPATNLSPAKQQKKVAQAAAAAAAAAQAQNNTADILDSDGVPRVLAKRKIQELVGQIDPAERLEPEVEDILLEVADEFIESVTTFACRLAKHRKSDTLEVKDLQLHLERNWNIRIPGFASDDIRSLRKPTVPSSYQAKVQAVNHAKLQSSAKKDHA